MSALTADESRFLDLTDAMRARGVKCFEQSGWRVEFFAPVEAPLKPDVNRVDPDICHCGHAMHAHNNGLCTASDCDPSKCIPPGAA